LELIKNYDIGINYHLGKENLLVDALSHKRQCNVTLARRMRPELCEEIEKLNLGMVNDVFVTMKIEPNLGGIWFRNMRERSCSIPDIENRITLLRVWR
jgi:hypothetical protein